jgi:hypothetical protein
LNTLSPQQLFQSANSEKVEDMTSMAGKLTLVMAATAGLGFMALSPTAVEAGVIRQNPTLAASAANTDVMRVRCERSLSNLWSCNDEVPVQGRREAQTRDRYANQPCERNLSNLWSCNDDGRVQVRREVQTRDRYAYHPCDHSYETARDGSRCGNRAADRRPGGR